MYWFRVNRNLTSGNKTLRRITRAHVGAVELKDIQTVETSFDLLMESDEGG